MILRKSSSSAKARCNGCGTILRALPGEKNGCAKCWVEDRVINAVECDRENSDRHVFIGNVTPL